VQVGRDRRRILRWLGGFLQGWHGLAYLSLTIILRWVTPTIRHPTLASALGE
jgi:hypothetical protein